jgi:hypothetical protein
VYKEFFLRRNSKFCNNFKNWIPMFVETPLFACMWSDRVFIIINDPHCLKIFNFFWRQIMYIVLETCSLFVNTKYTKRRNETQRSEAKFTIMRNEMKWIQRNETKYTKVRNAIEKNILSIIHKKMYSYCFQLGSQSKPELKS